MTNEELIAQLRNGGNRQEVLSMLYEQNRGIIYTTIKPYIGNSNEAEDLMQTAFFGLCEAVDRYDPKKGKFISYLPHWIHHAVNRSFQNMIVRLPDYIQSRIVSYNRIVSEYQKQNGLVPSDSYLKSKLHLSQDQLDNLRETILQNNVSSLDDFITDNLTVADRVADTRDVIEDVLEQIDREQATRTLWAEVETLSDTQTIAIRHKYIDRMTVQEISDHMNSTRSKTIRAIQNGCMKLRRRKKIKQVAECFGYSSNELYGGGLSNYLITGSSVVERTAIKNIEGG